MDKKSYFTTPDSPSQRRYEALRAFYADGLQSAEVAKKFNFSPTYFKKIRLEFSLSLKSNQNPFFGAKKTGPKNPFTNNKIIEEIITLRKQNHSIVDIRSILVAKDMCVSLDTIDNILKREGFAPLPKRTRIERISINIPNKIEAPRCIPLELQDEEFSTEKNAAPLIFLPLLEELGIIKAIQEAGFPSTSALNDVSSVLSFLALKLLGNERLSHDVVWNMDRVLGFFSNLNVLPKKSTLSSYSYRVSRSTNKKFLNSLNKIFKNSELEEGEFNLDFKAIPHWGDASILEKNWSGSQHRSIKSILALIIQDPSTGFLSYTDADIKKNQNDAVLDFVDFWKEGRGVSPKMLIFDSKFTTYENLSKLNESKEKVNFLTLRRRGKTLLAKVVNIPEDDWQNVKFEEKKRKYKEIRVYDEVCKLRKYKGKVRQLIITDNGRKNPSFLITNDFKMDVKEIVEKYGRRWLVEKEIAEQIAFFHLNQPSSSIVVKVDFDLTLSLLAHNLYKVISSKFSGFEKCTVPTIYRNLLESGARVKIEGKKVTVILKKKAYLPVLFQLSWLREKTKLSWMGIDIQFEGGTTT